MSKTFKVGDIVEWSSQSAGSRTTKRGTVTHIVPERVDPRTVGKVSMFGYGGWRPFESYIVEVPHAGKGKPKTYWPKVSALKVVSE